MRTSVAALVLLALTAGCSSSGSADDKPTAKNSGIVPPSVTASPVTEQKLRFSQSAKVAFRPTQKTSATLEIAVNRVRAGRIRDLAQYALDDQSKASRLYYVHADVTNLGPDDVGGSALPLWVTTTAGAVVAASSFVPPPARCGSRPLPTPFLAGNHAGVCLLFLVPRGDTLEAVSNRTAAGDVAVTWTGQVDRPLKN